MSTIVDIPAAENEVHALLDQHGLPTSKGHLDRALACHIRGDWAAQTGSYEPLWSHYLMSLRFGSILPLPQLPHRKIDGALRRYRRRSSKPS
jgi:hypothetical protein